MANSGQIPDEEAFAREVIRMCMENSFRSLRFSTDIGDWPAVMEIDVYLQKKDVGRSRRSSGSGQNRRMEEEA